MINKAANLRRTNKQKQQYSSPLKWKF